MRQAIFLAAIAALAAPVPTFAQVPPARSIDRTTARINVPVVQQGTTPKPVPLVTTRVAEYPLTEAVLWQPVNPFIVFLDRGDDGANHDSRSYRKATPPWTFERRVSRDRSISFAARREASQEPCPPGLQVVLYGAVLQRNGFTFDEIATGQSAGFSEYTIRNIKYYRGGDYERMEIPFDVTSIDVKLPFAKAQRCEAIIAFDVFVNGPRGADPFAPENPKLIGGSRAFKDVTATIAAPAAEPSPDLEKIRKPLKRKK